MEYRIRIEQDEIAENPREWDNIGVLCLKHRKYSLAWELEELNQENPIIRQCERDSNGQYKSVEYRCASWDDVADAIYQTVADNGDRVAVFMPVYMYDHSGISISTYVPSDWFHSRWDGGQIGFIFITRKKMIEEFGWKKLTPKRLEILQDILREEVNIYDRYISQRS